MSERIKIQIEFVGPNGERTQGPCLQGSDAPPIVLDEESWDKNQSIKRFAEFLRCKNDRGLEACMSKFDEFDCWHEAISQFLAEPFRRDNIGQHLLSFWISYGFHIARSLKGDYILTDVFRYLLPQYDGPTLTLYRGEAVKRHAKRDYGPSWTPRLDVARMFAGRRSDEGGGVVLEIDASPEMIVAYVGGHTERLGEFEFFIDTRLIKAVRTI